VCVPMTSKPADRFKPSIAWLSFVVPVSMLVKPLARPKRAAGRGAPWRFLVPGARSRHHRTSPIHIYNRWLKRLFLGFVPIATVSYFPVLSELHNPDPFGLPAVLRLITPLAGFVFVACSVLVWRLGVRRYASMGCRRRPGAMSDSRAIGSRLLKARSRGGHAGCACVLASGSRGHRTLSHCSGHLLEQAEHGVPGAAIRAFVVGQCPNAIPIHASVGETVDRIQHEHLKIHLRLRHFADERSALRFWYQRITRAHASQNLAANVARVLRGRRAE